jgi:hypothetical protein
MQVREGFIRLPNEGRIDVVTSSAQSGWVTRSRSAPGRDAALHGPETSSSRSPRRCVAVLAGMGGRSMETTNCWDPSEQSVAQRTREGKAADVFKFYEPPPAELRTRSRRDRAKIHALQLRRLASRQRSTGIEAEAAEIAETDPAQAERFYGNRIVAGLGSWADGEKWDARKVAPRS